METINFIELSVVVPCYNEEVTLPLFYRETVKVLASLADAGTISTVEFIFVDDGSTDHTLLAIKNLAEQDSRVRYVSFSRNFGKESAMLAGLQRASGRYIVTMDADLQDPPALIPSMLAAVASGEFDCAGTRRVTREGEPPVRSFLARKFYRIMANLSDIEVVDGARDFRLMNRPYIDSLLSLHERNRFSKGILPWIGFKTKWFEYENINRVAGETKWSFWKLFLYSIDGIIAFSSKPLALASILGAVFFLLSIVFIIIVAVRRIIWGDPVAGWASTVCIIMFCSGIQLFSTGILGQYLAKTYTEVKQRPHYIIREQK
ncbi:MAG: glycosyltransferase family 2 protein [Dysgonamonadaceae bacterium]|jgi:glycosyltransferase involved in cell wall biosynthesis|nr:glycosyltransferase family 2 protein [Dysgonamonadaceae bacterium]